MTDTDVDVKDADYLERVARMPPNPKKLVVWLHGLGADGHDFEPMITAFGQHIALDDVGVVLPHAPIRPITVNGGHLMRGWYDIISIELERTIDESSIIQSKRAILSLIKDLCQRYHLTTEDVFLGGFSQGSALALACTDTPLAGILALSGYQAIPIKKLPQTPLFVMHGVADDVVPLVLFERLRQNLKDDPNTQFATYDVGHGVCYEQILPMANFIADCLGLQKA